MGIYSFANWFGLLSVMDAEGTVFGGRKGNGVLRKPTFYKMPAEPQPPAPGQPPGGHYRIDNYFSELFDHWERRAYAYV